MLMPNIMADKFDRYKLKFMSIESVMPSNNLTLCWPLLLLPSSFPSNKHISEESVLAIRWPKCWSFSIRPCNEYSELISFRIDLNKTSLNSRSIIHTCIHSGNCLHASFSNWQNNMSKWKINKRSTELSVPLYKMSCPKVQNTYSILFPILHALFL